MSKEKQIEEMADNLLTCHTEFESGVGEIYTDYNTTAQKMFAKGYRKQIDGEWVLEHETYGKMICSNCKEEAPIKTVVDRTYTRHILYDKKPFCPNCGAKMKGV